MQFQNKYQKLALKISVWIRYYLFFEPKDNIPIPLVRLKLIKNK